MALSRRQQLVSYFFLAIALGTFVAIVYRATTVDYATRQREYLRRAAEARPPTKSEVLDGRVILMRDEALTISRNRLVFRGLEDGTILLDLYLLDLDSQYAYPRQITRELADEGFRLGDSRYRLLSVNQKTLTLETLK
jgi:hypothetical protein